jgi:hypothetical protein
MTGKILAYFMPGPLESIVVFIVFFFACVLPAVGLIALIVVLLVQKGKERKELGRKVQELTDEVEKLKHLKE